MARADVCPKERNRLWPAAVVAALLCATLAGGITYGGPRPREHHRWTEIIQTWDGQYLKIKQHTSQQEYRGSHFGPSSSGGSDPWRETRFTVGGQNYRWEGAFIPIAIQPDTTAVYVVVYDRETPGGSSRFRLYRSITPTSWAEIAPKDYPRHLAIQNTWLRANNGILPDRTVHNEYDVVANMDPAEPWFRRSLTAKLWSYLDDPAFSMEHEPSEDSVRQFKAKWIRTPEEKPSQGAPAAPRATLTEIQRGWNFDASIAKFTETLREKPDDLETYCGRGWAYALERYYEKALADFNEAIRIDPRHFHAYRGRGVVYRGMGELDKAIADFTEAIRLSTEPFASSMSYGGRGLAYEMKGDHDKALADLDEAIRLAPNNAKAHYARGLVALDKGELDKAIADLNEAIRLNPADEEAYHSRGMAYEKQGKKAEAEKDFEQASRLGYKPQ